MSARIGALAITCSALCACPRAQPSAPERPHGLPPDAAVAAPAASPAAGPTATSAPAATSSPASRPDGVTLRVAPRAMEVPGPLLARSRFEPSGLVWVGAWQRFLLVSDDTGLKEEADEQSPWLFTMTADGKVDPEPLVVEDMERVSDLEAIAWLDGETLLLLCSQSRSSKGRRPPKRSRLVRVRVQERGLRATAAVDLSGALLAAADGEGGAAWLRALGLRFEGAQPPARDAFELNIEGLTVRQGAALLGIKQPTDDQGRALIWELRDLERLFGSGRLERAALRVWRRLRLEVEADGRAAPGGIADLLWLADDSLLLCATYPGRPRAQSGTLWRVAAAEEAERLTTFGGLKPEGIAQGAQQGSFTVVFDRWEEIPFWAQVEIAGAAAPR